MSLRQHFTDCLVHYRSDTAQRIAQSVKRLAYEQEAALFDFRRGDGATLLLVIDRMDDPVTPLLSQWTYQVRNCSAAC